MKKVYLVFLLALISSNLIAQSGDWGINFHGFVKGDYMFDSRQTVSAREGHFLLYPASEVLDANGEDINAVPNFNILSIQSRLKGVITGPDLLGAKASAVIEAAFFGQSDATINTLRLRHAFIKLDWEKTTLLLGQYWHPMFITDIFPGTVSFNTGVPFQPFSRNPQIRLVHKFSDLSFTLVAASQRDFVSTGPAGGSSTYLRNALIPILNFGLDYKSDNLMIGANVNYMTLRPALVTGANYKTDATVSSVSFMGFAKITSGDFGWKLEGILGQNNTDLLMLGGYAVKSVDPVTGIAEYTNIKNMTLWTEIYYGQALQYGIFAGLTKNLGAVDDVAGSIYTRGVNIESVMRVSPRIQYSVGKVRFAAELEYTSAAYGTAAAKTLKVENTKNIVNTRLLLATYYFF